MGFIFRTIFWLGLALVVVPPHARLGGDEEVEWRDIDLGLELHNASYALWGLTVQAASACETNPELCKAAEGLIDTTVKTATSLVKDTEAGRDEAAAEPPKSAAPRAKKIQARVE
jgi:hypothetical protein